jgi:hypothetical protein
LINKLNNYKLDFRLSQGKNAAGLFQAESQVLAMLLVLTMKGRFMATNYQSRRTVLAYSSREPRNSTLVSTSACELIAACAT